VFLMDNKTFIVQCFVSGFSDLFHFFFLNKRVPSNLSRSVLLNFDIN
jgi:hypothetical protein